MGKRGERAMSAGPSAKKFAKRANEASRSSQEGLLRRRVLTQKTRISRALQRASSVSAQLAAHIDGANTYEEAAPEDDMAESLRSMTNIILYVV